jgi:hypothetical protein
LGRFAASFQWRFWHCADIQFGDLTIQIRDQHLGERT